ncbi:hypothetical protein Rmet_6420 [Cupriavidus metallidurans CH34]|uniref:Uncharacterized protein n=1 Tax=Cupriavidus metallidurans (strain ATCC 43123 / DSM 2839 / NBRC 102507 / CH34) TaxID=266264 RepID=D3DXL8_CUPMC|nr:hypothetical protein Rmet_6420 [Cupriavidus metallidurans CH34]
MVKHGDYGMASNVWQKFLWDHLIRPEDELPPRGPPRASRRTPAIVNTRSPLVARARTQ